MITNLHPVDAYGALKAEFAELKARMDQAHALVVALGEGAHEGAMFRATVSTAEYKSVDRAAIIEKLQPSHQLLTAHTTYSERTSVRVVARNGREAA